ncbi:MAG: D-2-hydroxyacid dehydrogenase [Bacillota bacterium]|nr:D-2-hydroxyacid dehydrogenase [Bacillota bacterium]
MKLKNILVSIPKLEGMQEAFTSALPQAAFTFNRAEKLSDQELARFDALVGNTNPEILEKMTDLKMLQLISSGVSKEHLDFSVSRPGLVLCSASGAYGQAISEHMLAALMALLKRLHEYRDDMQTAVWQSRGAVKSPRGLKILIVGAGSIGSEFAKLMQKLGSRTIGLRRSPGGSMDGFDEVYTMERLDSLLPLADVVALSLPETPDTINLMDERRFALMKPGSYLLNVGRGSAVDQDALLHALRSGHLAGASIDVTTPEPLPKDHPLWQEKNLLLTPHIAGFFHLRATYDNVIDIAIQNLKAWPEGPFIAKTDVKTGYRER